MCNPNLFFQQQSTANDAKTTADESKTFAIVALIVAVGALLVALIVGIVAARALRKSNSVYNIPSNSYEMRPQSSTTQIVG